MAETVNIYDAKTRLSQLVERASAGEEIIIAKAGKPLVKLVPVGVKAKRRKPAGDFVGTGILEALDEPWPADFLEAFETKIEP
ncbi:MAG: type II toxin-antitoxin system Phd/YefM family antitoxin [Proteobacteria bacterium]|nr:type II toxin-antitoxin system Phd/YefM family antitoxin [Pseudomonadota bacterium]